MDSRVLVFFPVYNEGPSAASLLRRVDAACRQLGRNYRVVVVDDGSTDGSVTELSRQAAGVPLTLLAHGENRGLKEALETGLRWLAAETKEEDIAVFMDGDDTHDPGQIPEMLAAIERGADVVIASRFRPGAVTRGVPRYRQLLSLGANLWGILLFRLPGVRDYACGYRAVRAGLVKRLVDRAGDKLLELPRYGFICSVEILVKLGDLTGRFAEVPLQLRYDRKQAQSKMNAFRTSLGYFALFWLRLRRKRTYAGAQRGDEETRRS